MNNGVLMFEYCPIVGMKYYFQPFTNRQNRRK